MLGTLHIFRLLLALYVIYYSLLVLFGAPLLSDIHASFRLATVLVFLTTVPVCLTFDREVTIADIVKPLSKCSNRVVRCKFTVGTTLLGCWLGAFVIPLDWDQDWQRYPYPNLIGSFIGFLAGLFAGHLFLFFNPRGKFARD
ncbi:unnamed protein product [Auanema sp. JU1783]|nr:unnamed protein product [Auanema sp. JU1783]